MRPANTPILEWWQAHSKLLPVLSRVAKWLLDVQATSVRSEGEFSAAGQVISRLRANLNPKRTRALTLLHANDDLLTAVLEKRKKGACELV